MKHPLLIFLLIFIHQTGFSQYYGEKRDQWLSEAKSLIPELYKASIDPIQHVNIEKDSTAFQGWKAVPQEKPESVYEKPLKMGDSFILDFGDHFVGSLSFFIKSKPSADAPARLKITFAEVPSELGESFDPFKATISRSWLQDEIINIDVIPDSVYLPRRYAFRYVKVEVLSSSPWYSVLLSNFKVHSISSANPSNYYVQTDTSLISKIAKVSARTLANCMQTVFEDGPKRDRRLWIGDLRQQALANYYTYKNNDLVKRSLYLLAALARKDGVVHATVFEKPTPHPQEHVGLDYALLFNVTLKEYVENTGDNQAGKDLWEVAKRQVDYVQSFISKEGEFVIPEKPDWWYFIDWNNKLDKETSLLGTIIFSIQATADLAELIGMKAEKAKYNQLLSKMRKKAKANYFDKEASFFISGNEQQLSVGSQVWMVLSEVVKGNEAVSIMKRTLGSETILAPGSPYSYHYYLEALVKTGLTHEARKVMERYWGGMIKKGSDTFWEVYDPKNDYKSPYNNHLIIVIATHGVVRQFILLKSISGSKC